jgi:hypothetical protein
VLDRIAGEDRDRATGLDLQIEQTLRKPVGDAFGLAIGQPPPLPVRAGALRKPGALRRFLCPFRQRCRDMVLIGLQRNPRLQNNDAVAPPLDRDVARQPIDLAKGGFRQHRGGIPTHIASPGIRSSFADLG